MALAPCRCRNSNDEKTNVMSIIFISKYIFLSLILRHDFLNPQRQLVQTSESTPRCTARFSSQRCRSRRRSTVQMQRKIGRKSLKIVFLYNLNNSRTNPWLTGNPQLTPATLASCNVPTQAWFKFCDLTIDSQNETGNGLFILVLQ